MRRCGRIDDPGGAMSGDHIYWGYGSDEEYGTRMAAFCASGLTADEKVMHVAPERLQDPVLSALEETGHDVGRLLDVGQLEMRDVEQVYRSEGDFDQQRQIEVYRGATEEARSQGYTGLRVGADGTPLVELDDFIAYELRADLLASQSPYAALCAYDRRVCDPTVLSQLESVHALRVNPNDHLDGPPFSIHGTDDGGIALAGELDLLVRERLHELLMVANDAVASPTIDLSGLDFADLCSVRSIAEAVQGLTSTRGEVVFHDAPGHFRRVWELGRFNELVPSVVFRSGQNA